jgi:hypothetical protein
VEGKQLKRWQRRQKLAAPGRFYGADGTIHTSDDLEIEVLNGKIIGVWFRCMQLPFRQIDIDAFRAADIHPGGLPRIVGIEVLDPVTPAPAAPAAAG